MTQLTQPIQLVLYEGPTLILAQASFLSKLLRVSQPSANGQGYVSFVASAPQFSPLQTLDSGSYYIVVSAPTALPYTLPASTQAIASDAGSYNVLADAGFAL